MFSSRSLFNQRNVTRNYNDTVKYLRGLRDEFARGAPAMSLWEQAQAHEILEDEQKELIPKIDAQVSSGLRSSYAALESARQARAKAEQAEAARWNDDKRLKVMQLAAEMLKHAKSPAEVAEIWKEAKTSQDIHKMRGTADAMADVLSDVKSLQSPRDRIEANQIVQEAKQELARIRNTKELEAAQHQVTEAESNVRAKHAEASSIARELHGGAMFAHNPIDTELKRAVVGEGSSIEILAPSDSRVTGIIFHEPKGL